MTQSEKHSWASLLMAVLIFFWFHNRMTDDFTINQLYAPALLGVLITFGVLTIIVETAMAIIFSLTDKKSRQSGEIYKDERDLLINARANRNAYYTLSAALVFIVWQSIAGQLFTGENTGAMMLLRLEGPAELFYALICALFFGSFMKLVSTLYYYRQ